MKIAQITSVYISVPPKTYGGTERIVYHLCQGLDRRGHHVELFASGDSQVNCTLQAVLPIATQYDPQSTFYLEKEYEARNTYNLYRQAERFDLIHAHWTTLAPYFSVFTTIPTLVTYAYIEKELHQYYKRHFPQCLPVCVSRAQANMLGDDALPVVYNAVDPNEIPFNDRPEDFFMIVGRMTPGKGIAEAIRIARKTKVKLLIVGHVTTHLPWSEEYFLKEIKPHIDGDRICYVAGMAYRELVKTMGKAKGFLFPLQWDEPFGMVVIEAMAAGTPVLAYRRGSMPELIRNGETGYLVENEQEMLEMTQRIATIDRWRCRSWVEERFSVEQMVDGYEHLYRKAIGGDWNRDTKRDLPYAP
ncbi:MAG TPA: glycosyltransferase family 4 protein [Candidatus Binatia bacterium]|jgi:glycosyltransferase involved in cell wall biosynthesis